jgi:asparagine synthase (glutamine-hydrolysing)
MHGEGREFSRPSLYLDVADSVDATMHGVGRKVIAAPGMSALETAVGFPMGLGPEEALPEVTGPPLEVLEDTLAAALSRPPCCVAFSGGRDSSLVLAAAVRAAARMGYEPPVAVTTRFARESETDEEAWQTLVLDHLRVADRVVIDFTDELDFVGETATTELRRRGALFPANVHSLAPLLRHAAGGSLLVGLGGDEILGGYRWTRVNDLLARRRRPEPRDLGRLSLAALPASLRARVRPRRGRLGPPEWLRPQAARLFVETTRLNVDEPIRFDRAVPHAMRARQLRVAAESIRRLSTETLVEAPLLDARFVSGLARAGSARGWGGRSAVMRALADGILPAAILDRSDKARFTAVFFGASSRRFAEGWTGGGLDDSLVDPDVLRRVWLDVNPDARAAIPLQVAWLHDQGLAPDGTAGSDAS